MQAIIFTTLKNKTLLQQILNWGSVSHVKFQMYFTGKNFSNILKQKHDIIITTEKFIARRLKNEGYKVVLVEKEWRGLNV